MASGTDEVLGKSNETHGDLLDDNSQSGHEEELAAEPERHSRSSPLRETQLEPEHAVQQRQKVISANVAYAAKLRPALDVLNRLRYDPNLDEEDHVVGYRDRHDGVQELCVSLWKSDTTDEEFIPQHRIKYFKRRSDGVVVWDRFMRLDLVFGSGLKQIAQHQQPAPHPPLAPLDSVHAVAAAADDAAAAAAAPPSPSPSPK